MKTSELTGAALDWAVADAQGYFDNDAISVEHFLDMREAGVHWTRSSIDWAQGGPIIEREKLGVWWAHHVVDDEGNEYGNHWYSETGLTDENADERHVCMTGETPLIAAMRCYVASKLSDEIDVPNTLKG